MTDYRSGRGRRNGCIITLFVIAAIVIFIVIKGCDKKEQVEDYDQNTIKMAFKPELPNPETKTIVAASDRVVFGVVPNPERGAKLVTTKYNAVIKKVAKDMVKTGKLPSSESNGLIHALQGIVMIESGGNPLAKSPVGACGVVQMMPDTARSQKLKVDAIKSSIILAKIRAGKTWLYPQLCQVDERFDPYKCIRGGGRYLVYLFNLYGRWDFTISAYHGGPGNINKLLKVYMTGNYPDIGTNKQNIEKYQLSYQKIFFDNSPTKNPGTYKFLQDYKSGKKDFSGWYFWSVSAAQNAVALYQNDKKTFRKKLWNWKNLTVSRRRELMPEIVWYPKGVKTYKDADELDRKYASGELVKAPTDERVFGFRLDEDNIGIHASQNVRNYFFGTQPETVGLLMTIAYLTRLESDRWDESLTVTSLVRSRAYQKLLGSTSHSVHTVGRAIDFSRKTYTSGSQRAGFQYALDYLRACGDICYAKEGDYAIHVALNPNAVGKYRKIYQDGMTHLASQK